MQRTLHPTHAPSRPAHALPQVAFPQELAQRLTQPAAAAAANSTPGGGGMNLARSAALWDPLRIEAKDVETGYRYNLYVKPPPQQLAAGGAGSTAGAAASAVRLSRDGRHLVVSGLHVQSHELTRSRVG